MDDGTDRSRRSILAVTGGAVLSGLAGCTKLARVGGRASDDLATGARFGVRAADDVGDRLGEAEREGESATYAIDRDVTVTARGPALEVPFREQGVSEGALAVDWSFLVRSGGPVWLGVMTSEEYQYYTTHQRFRTVTQSGLPSAEASGTATAPVADYVVAMDTLPTVAEDGTTRSPEPSVVSVDVSFSIEAP